MSPAKSVRSRPSETQYRKTISNSLVPGTDPVVLLTSILSDITPATNARAHRGSRRNRSAGLVMAVAIAAVVSFLPYRDSSGQLIFTGPVPLNTNAATDDGDDCDRDVATDGGGNLVGVF